MKLAAGICVVLLTVGVALPAGDATVQPVTVCELLEKAVEFEGRPLLVIGRYSFRSKGRLLGQDGCGAPASAGEKPRSSALTLTEDDKNAPKVPQPLQIDARVVEQKLEVIKKGTRLGQYRFGSADYDRWAAVYCSVDKDSIPAQAAATDNPLPTRLLIRGDGAIIFLGE